MSAQDFRDACADGAFINYDGFGYLATAQLESDQRIDPSQVASFTWPDWATHVTWYNR